MTLPTNLTASTSVGHVDDHNTLHLAHNAVIDVAAEYEVPDGVADNTTAIQTAINDSDALVGTSGRGAILGPPVYLRSADWRFSTQIDWKGSVPILGDGPFGTRLFWDGAEGATSIVRGNGSSWMKGIRFEGGTAEPGVWVDMSTDPNHDYGDWLEDIYFVSWSQTSGEAALKTGAVTNCHLRRLRFGGGQGFCIIARSHTLGTFSLRDFTVDAQFATNGVFNGVLNIHKTGQGTPVFELANGRIEAAGLDWAAPAGIIVVDSDPVNNLGQTPAIIHLRGLDVATDSTQPVSLVHQDTTQTSSASAVHIESVTPGFDSVIGGNWDPVVVPPDLPTGYINSMYVGKHEGQSASQKKQNFAQTMHVGWMLGLPVYTDATRPSASGRNAGETIWNSDDSAPNFADGTNWRDASGVIT